MREAIQWTCHALKASLLIAVQVMSAQFSLQKLGCEFPRQNRGHESLVFHPYLLLQLFGLLQIGHHRGSSRSKHLGWEERVQHK